MKRQKTGGKKAAPFPGNPADARGFYALSQAFLESQAMAGRTPQTLKTERGDLAFFIVWCGERSLRRPDEIARQVAERYQRHLFHYRKANGQPLSFRTQQSRLVSVRTFFRWLVRHGHLAANPAADLDLPKIRRGLPRDVLTPDEAERILAVPDISDPEGLRDRAILETLYSTGMRRLEIANLTVWDVDRARGTVFIREGKGRRDRVVPIGERALAWLAKYEADARPELVVSPDPRTLFLTNTGVPWHLDALTGLVGRYVRKAATGKAGACHLFRHTLATLMLENGADIRFIQQILGHQSLATTQIYTQVSIRKLKEIHTATHPGARLEKKTAAAKEESGGDAVDSALKAELLNALAAEAIEESDAK